MNYEQVNIEQGIIGATLVYFEEAVIFRALLEAEDFEDITARDCFLIYLAANDAGEYLQQLCGKGYGAYANEAMNNEYTHMRPYWQRMARTLVIRRRNKVLMQDVSMAMANAGNETMLMDIASAVDKARAREEAIETEDDGKDLAAKAISEILDDDKSRRLYTGIPPIDSLVCGFRKGNVSVLGAEPSVGKTALALNIAHRAVEQGKRTVYFSLEMSAVQLLERMIAHHADIDYQNIVNKEMPAPYLEKYKEAAKQLTFGKKLFIFDTIYFLEDMFTKILQLKPDLVIVDFLQFCRTSAAKADNTADRIEYMVSEFKRIAKLEYCPCHIMLLSQHSRQANADKQSMFALKGSSAIEQGGDVILLLDRPAVRDPAAAPQRANIRVAKNKFGKAGSTELYFEGEYQRFREIKVNDIFLVPDEEERKPW